MEEHGIDLVKIVVLLGAGVIAVPIFTRLKLGSVLAYFMAGMAIGPFGFGLFGNPTSMLHVAEFGVIMLLFIIGLEMNPTRLWSLKRDILGLGAAQVLTCGLLLTCAGYMAGFSPPRCLHRRHGLRPILHRRGDADARRTRRDLHPLRP